MGGAFPAPVWYRLARALLPSRCREVPEAQDPDTVLLRQFAIWRGRAYLQQFASAEHPDWYHTHPWTAGTLAIGLSGGLREWVYCGPVQTREFRAPYLRYMGPDHIHRSAPTGPGHTSIFVGFGRKTDHKYYLRAAKPVHWASHVMRQVKRL